MILLDMNAPLDWNSLTCISGVLALRRFIVPVCIIRTLQDIGMRPPATSGVIIMSIAPVVGATMRAMTTIFQAVIVALTIGLGRNSAYCDCGFALPENGSYLLYSRGIGFYISFFRYSHFRP